MSNQGGLDKRYGMYDAIVVDVTDPLFLDRIKVRVFEVLGDLTSPWVFPASTPPHWSWKPAVGDPVFVQYRAGDVDRPVYWGTWYSQDAGKISTVPQESRDEYPFHRMIKTPQGHKIEFKDISTQRNANTGEEEPIADSTQYVKVTTVGGHVIDLVDTQGAEKISITHSNGTAKIEIDKDGKIVIESTSDNIEITASGDVKVSGATIELNTPTAGVVTGSPGGTWPVDSFTGAPISGVSTVKAG